MDQYGNFLIELPSHHAYIDDRGFFSKMMSYDRLRIEKESRVEAFSKNIIIY
jgi:hypothetical protein